jgi:hypothetical protein
MFKCDKCGQCCRHLANSEVYKELDRGDGVCKYLDGNLCSIYDDRPVICNIDKAFELYFKHVISKEDYIKLNQEACLSLKRS